VPVPLQLRTDRLLLRRLTAEHLDDLVELDSDPEVMRYISNGEPNSRERYVSELLPHMSAWDDQSYGFLAAYEEGRSWTGSTCAPR
jgi:RimJ/RimL family protein N-acetyltransferase